jgi:hypothetical protein
MKLHFIKHVSVGELFKLKIYAIVIKIHSVVYYMKLVSVDCVSLLE